MNTITEPTLVMKFGGASLSKPEQFDLICKLILAKTAQYKRIVCVVSAMGKTTDELFTLAHSINPYPPQREIDMLLTVGERVSMSLLAMALAKHNRQAVSFTGSQAGIITCSRHSDAKIIDVKPHRLIKCFEQNKIVIVAGFQGVSKEGEITTLGRGGSDTTAVALGACLQAEKIEFYKDVAGFCEEDPKKNPSAKLFATLTYDEAITLSSNGAKIMHARAVVLAKKNCIPLHVRSFLPEYQDANGTVIMGDETRPNRCFYEENETAPTTACITL